MLFIALLSSCTEQVKKPSVAGLFYPSDRSSLEQLVDGYLSHVEPMPVNGRLMALVVPHAGYVYSGQVAAHAYGQLRGKDIHTVILIGPSHHSSFQGISVYPSGVMRTPLGDVAVNEKVAASLVSEENDVFDFRDAFSREHSIEVQLPFLQRTLGSVRIVPILVGTPTRRSFDHITQRITELMKDDKGILMIASTDLSHYHDYDTALKMDRMTIDSLERMSVEDVEGLFRSGRGEMCGGYPVIFTLAVARNIGATNGVLYTYANSGDVTGDKSRVVGYAALGLYKAPLNGEQKEKLLKLARKSIETYVLKKQVLNEEITDKRLLANGATFVTINRQRRLRGCIGNIQPTMPLHRSVVQNAVAACSRDGRFMPISPPELEDIEIEVTVLSPLEPLLEPEDISIGKHGLYIVKGDRSGILLPQVAEEYSWDANTFLEQVSIKAGLDRNAWKSARLYRFTAEIIK